MLNPLASGEVVLSETERQMGVVVCDIGGGTTDLAIYIDGDVWHTMVLAVGGNHITSDIATLAAPAHLAGRRIKKQFGSAMVEAKSSEDEYFPVRGFWGRYAGRRSAAKSWRKSLKPASKKYFVLLLQEIKRSGYDGLLPAGMVLTGGTSNSARHSPACHAVCLICPCASPNRKA